MSLDNPPQVLFFDVFGTVVEWRNCVSTALREAAQRAVNSPDKALPPSVRDKVSAMTDADWLAIAEEWRRSYGTFTRGFDASKDTFIPVDEHHYRAIQTILQSRGLDTLFTDAERWDLTLSWHRLDPWSDSVEGLNLLNRKFRTCTLSNGNIALLEDLRRHGPLAFAEIASAEDFKAYKPAPRVYLGAVERFGLRPEQCAMVATHLHDLKAAKANGLQTIFVARPLEGTSDRETAKTESYVDMWVDLDAGGLVEVARRFGIE